MLAGNSTQYPYQACLIPDLPEQIQHKVRYITNYVVVPLNLLVPVMALICNALVVCAVARTKSLQQPPFLMLCSLAVTDILFSQYSFLRFIEVLLHEHMCPGNASDEISALAALFLIATLGNLAVVSRDRYLAVKKPWWYRAHMTKLRAITMSCVSWLLSTLTALMMYLASKFEGHFQPVRVALALLFYILCFLVITLSYLGLFCTKTKPDELLHIRTILEREKRTAHTVGLILLVLLLTFLPALLLPLGLNAAGIAFNPLRPFSTLFIQLNGLLNPLLNFGRSKAIRKAVRKFLKCPQQVQPESDSSGSKNNDNINYNDSISDKTVVATPQR